MAVLPIIILHCGQPWSHAQDSLQEQLPEYVRLRPWLKSVRIGCVIILDIQASDAVPGSGLSRSLGLGLLVFYGLGIIIGAGVYVVIGDVIAKAGALAVCSFALAGALAGSGAMARGVVYEGYPADAILAGAREQAATLIALTTHGRTGLARWDLGSVTEKVLRGGECPILPPGSPLRRGERVILGGLHSCILVFKDKQLRWHNTCGEYTRHVNDRDYCAATHGRGCIERGARVGDATGATENGLR